MQHNKKFRTDVESIRWRFFGCWINSNLRLQRLDQWREIVHCSIQMVVQIQFRKEQRRIERERELQTRLAALGHFSHVTLVRTAGRWWVCADD